MNLSRDRSQYEHINQQKVLEYYNAKAYDRYIDINSLVDLGSSGYINQLVTKIVPDSFSFFEEQTNEASDQSKLDLL